MIRIYGADRSRAQCHRRSRYSFPPVSNLLYQTFPLLDQFECRQCARCNVPSYHTLPDAQGLGCRSPHTKSGYPLLESPGYATGISQVERSFCYPVRQRSTLRKMGQSRWLLLRSCRLRQVVIVFTNNPAILSVSSDDSPTDYPEGEVVWLSWSFKVRILDGSYKLQLMSAFTGPLCGSRTALVHKILVHVIVFDVTFGTRAGPTTRCAHRPG